MSEVALAGYLYGFAVTAAALFRFTGSARYARVQETRARIYWTAVGAVIWPVLALGAVQVFAWIAFCRAGRRLLTRSRTADEPMRTRSGCREPIGEGIRAASPEDSPDVYLARYCRDLRSDGVKLGDP